MTLSEPPKWEHTYPLMVRGQFGRLIRIHVIAPEFVVTPSTRIERDFKLFHEANPHVYAELEELARRWWEKRHPRRMGIATIYETARYNRHLSTNSPKGFKLNNNFRALYARLLIAHHPEWDGVIETRERLEKLDTMIGVTR
jgi:hypothetical protein